jgi:hypothetical protein
VVKRELQVLLPGIKIRLDVDHLNDLGKLEVFVADSAVFLIFLSKGYFRSVNCRRELYAAFASNRPIVVLHEVDEAKGGATIEAFKEECRVSCIEERPDGYPAYSGPEEALRRVFGHADPVMWVRATEFQIVSLKAIASRILPHLQYYTKHPAELAAGLKLAGELGPIVLSEPITLLVCGGNQGALAVAEEICQAATVDRLPEATSPIVLLDAANPRTMASLAAAETHTPAVLLIYLTKDTFVGDNGTLANVVQRALDRSIPLMLVHEQDPSRGACAFRVFYSHAPDFLLKPPYKIFDIVAVPLYFSPEHREVSLRQMLKGMQGLQKSSSPAHPFEPPFLAFGQRRTSSRLGLRYKRNEAAALPADDRMLAV